MEFLVDRRSLSTLNMSSYCLPDSMISDAESAVNLIEDPF